jgi:hypothetical protein
MNRKEKRHRDGEGIADLSPLLHEGEAQVQCVGWEKTSMYGGKILFLFKYLEEGESHGQIIKMWVPQHKKYTDSSKFLRMWILATGRRPDRFDRLSAEVFKGKVFRASIRTVTGNSKQKPLSELQKYSVIDELLELLAG